MRPIPSLESTLLAATRSLRGPKSRMALLGRRANPDSLVPASGPESVSAEDERQEEQ